MRKRALALGLACATGGLFVAWTAGTAIGAGPHGPGARRVAAERIEVPIKQTTLTVRQIVLTGAYSVPVKIGNASPIDAMLHTGSTGLRVLRASVPELAYSVSKQTSIYGYGSGERLVGVIGRAVAAIGQVATDGPIPIQIVKSVDCGFGAVVGVSMGNADAVNPLAHIGAHSWIVDLPRPGEARPER